MLLLLLLLLMMMMMMMCRIAYCVHRVISRAPGLKLVVQTLLSSLRPIGNIVLIFFVLLFRCEIYTLIIFAPVLTIYYL